MRISDLVKATGVKKETIHYYVREGLLPKPRKIGPNSAEYSDEHIERIKWIKDLQDQYFLPLSTIRKVLRKYRNIPEGQKLLRFKSEFFQPLEMMLPSRVRGEKAMIKTTELKSEGLERMEKMGVISPEMVDGVKVYSQVDVTIGKIIVEMRELGLTPDEGYDMQLFAEGVKKLREIAFIGNSEIIRVEGSKMTRDELLIKAPQCYQLLGALYYHLFIKLAEEDLNQQLDEKYKSDVACGEN